MCNFTSPRTAAWELKDSKTCSVYSVSQLCKKDIKFSDTRQFKCKLKCCRSCTFCERAVTKERCKSRYCTNLQREIKVCEKCFLCRSLVFCKYCTKCPTCCSKSTCRGKTSEFLANLTGSGCRSESCSNPERGLPPPLSDSAKTHTFFHCHKPLCQSPQEQLRVGGITSAYRQERSGTSTKSKISGLFQPTIFSPQTKQLVEAYTRSEQSKSLPQGGEIQNGDTGNHQDFPPTRGVGDLNRLQGRLLSYPHTGTVQEISEISCRGSDIPVQSSALWSVHSTYGVHCGSKGGETDGHTQGYKNPPVPRRLVGESQVPPNLEESNVLQGQPLHPIKHALQVFTDASKEGWGAHLNERTARWSWSLPESKLHINDLELKAVFLALKEFQDLCSNQIVLVATDNTTVVSYINKEGGMKSGPLCALLWRILTWCTSNQVTLKARHIPGQLNVVADKLSRLGQTIQTEWSLLPEVFQTICSRWHRPQIDLFATRFKNKLPLFVSPVPDPLATAVDALNLPWEDLEAYAFPPAAILGKVVEKLQDSPCKRIILIALGWPNMPWVWDLVTMSSQIPLSLPNLPNLLTQPFNQIPHRNLANLNLHAWLLEPQQLKSRASLRQWQLELRLLKEDQPDQSIS